MRFTLFKTVYTIYIAAVFSFLGFSNLNAQSHVTDIKTDIYITISSTTSSDELAEISNFLSTHNIESEFSKIKRDEQGHITAINILLKDANSVLTTQKSSNVPISEITFGKKDNLLFLNQKETTNAHETPLAGLGSDDYQAFSNLFSKLDSLKLNFNDSFADFFNESHLDSLRQHFETLRGRFFEYKNDLNASATISRYSNQERKPLVIINGKPATLEALQKLDDTDNLKSLDVLKPETAMSIYGDKANNGALIAVTKDN